jgi:hypothetical protein
LLLATITAALTYGQTALATLTGVVTDPTGAVVANAPVRATHVDTGTVISGTTSQTGLYTIPQLPVGRYEVTVTQPGFKTFRREGLTLAATQVLRLDVTLEVGATNESVTVTAEATLLKTDSGTLSHNLTVAQFTSLPLLTVGTFIRDPFQIALTLPGTVNQGVAFGPRINGLANTTNQYRLDGEVLGNMGFSSITTRTQPSPDAIEEVAVQTSNFNAEFGSVSGALFNITIKSGTNRYHGTVYDYAVNEVLNAEDHASHSRNRVRRHDYGFNIGGPIRIPWLYDGANKSFFFFNWEQYRDTQLQTAFSRPTVPIQAYRDGDFSGLIPASGNTNLRINATPTVAAHDYRDPTGAVVPLGTVYDPRSTRQVACSPALSLDCGAAGTLWNVRTPFPGNRIPASLFDSVSLAIQNKYIPQPNVPGLINNYFNPFSTSRITSSPALKFDHNLRDKGRVSFTWSDNRTESPIQALGGLAEGFIPSPITQNRGTYESSPTYRVNFDYTIKPTMILHLGAGWSVFLFKDDTLIRDYNPEADIGLKGARLNRNFPRFASTVTAVPALGGMNPMGPTGQINSPERRPSGSASLTWIRGNHSIKMGGDFRQDMLTTINLGNTAGSFGFGGANAAAGGNGITWQPSLLNVRGYTGGTNVGFEFANFLLGSVRTVTLATPLAYRRSKQQWGTYLQDTWRVRRNLTMDFGLRWDYGTYTAEDYGRLGNLSLTEPNPSAGGRLGALIYEATCRCQFAQNYPFAIGPRVGVAYTITPRMVIRGGFGITYGSTGTVSGSATNTDTVPTPQEGQDAFRLRDGIPSSVNPQWPVFDPARGHPDGSVVGAPAMVDRNAGRPERVYQWNISVQRELSRNWVVEASYVGNRAVWLSTGGFQDLNAISVETLNRYGFTVGNLADATLLNQRLDLLTPAQRATLAARGVGLPYSSFPSAGATAQTVLQSLRPYPQYSTGISPFAPMGRSWYDSFQITLNKRFANGLQVSSNYTFSKNLQHINAFDVFNRANGKDIVGGNPPQVLRVSFLYELPRPASTMPVLGNRLVAYSIGGWQISSGFFFQTAAYLGRPPNGATNPISRWLGRGPGGAQLKKNPDGSYMSPWSVNWVDSSGQRRTDPLDINCRCFDPEKTIVLNPAAWQIVPDGVWAEQTQILAFFRQSRRPSESMNLARNFRFGQESRFTLQIRMEFQNVFNRTYLPAPQINANFTTPQYSLDGGRYISGFGTFGNLRNAGALGQPRSGQFVARFSF